MLFQCVLTVLRASSVRSLRPLVIALIPGQQRSLDKLKAMRQKLAEEVVELINDFGPRLYADFNEVCQSLFNPQNSTQS